MSLSFQNRLKISCSESSFREIRTNGGLYVDKTHEIYINLGFGKYFFIARPRRFGKSLLCSTLVEMFSGSKDLFDGLWIEKSDWKWETHPVIHFDMTFVASGNATKESLRSSMLNVIYRIAQEHDIPLNLTIEPASVFSNLVIALHKKYGQRVVVIIDEYDKPLTELIDKPDVYMQILTELKTFYGQLKPLTAHLRFVFITGVFKFARAGIFSDLNNLTDLTFSPAAGQLVGYTQEELEANFSEVIDALGVKLGKSRDEMLQILKDKYNGYHFGHEQSSALISDGIYNPFGINHTFANNDLLEKWFESGNPAALIKKLHVEECQELLYKHLVCHKDALTSSFSPATMTSLAMLYYAGYLTIGAYDPETSTLSLRFPNTEVSRAFSTRLINELVPEKLTALVYIANEITKTLRAQSFDSLQSLFNQALANIGYQLLLSREDQYQLAFFMLLNCGGLRARVEEVTQDGRIDIIIEMHTCVYILELKIDQAAVDAIGQIKNKDYARKYRHLNVPIWAIGLKLAAKQKDKDAPRNAVLELLAEQI